MQANMKARVSNLAKTEAEWSKITFTPFPGELVIYLPSRWDAQTCARLKIGDGIHTNHELPFVIEQLVTEILNSQIKADYLDAGRITNYF